MKNVLITGGSGGIGGATALYFANKGYQVAVHYYKNESSAMATVQEILDLGGNAIAVKADLAQSAQVNEMVRFANDNLGAIDILVNNAGIAEQKLFTDITDSDYERMMDINLKSVFNCSRAVLQQMVSKKSGSIVNVSSMWGVVGASCEVHYSAAKAGVIGMTKALAKEVAPSNIRVNCIAPGVVDTQMNMALTQEDMQELIMQTPLGRIGTPNDIAEAIYFLATADFITGQVLTADGGITL